MATKKLSRTELVFRAATPSRWPDVEKLFGERGACGGCWCMAWRLRNKDWLEGKGAKNKRAFKKLVRSGEKPGIRLPGVPSPREGTTFTSSARECSNRWTIVRSGRSPACS